MVQRIQLLDLIDPALYSLILAGMTRLMWRNRLLPALSTLPVTAGLGAYAENAGLALIFASYPDVAPGLVALSSALSWLKLALLLLAIAPLAVAVALRLRTGLVNMRPQGPLGPTQAHSGQLRPTQGQLTNSNRRGARSVVRQRGSNHPHRYPHTPSTRVRKAANLVSSAPLSKSLVDIQIKAC